MHFWTYLLTTGCHVCISDIDFLLKGTRFRRTFVLRVHVFGAFWWPASQPASLPPSQPAGQPVPGPFYATPDHPRTVQCRFSCIVGDRSRSNSFSSNWFRSGNKSFPPHSHFQFAGCGERDTPVTDAKSIVDIVTLHGCRHNIIVSDKISNAGNMLNSE